jgi:hypothetical protein
MKTHRIVRISALVVLFAAVAVLGWHFEGGKIGNRTHNSAAGPSLVTTAARSTGQLVSAVTALDHPVYWVGPAVKPTTYELTEDSNGETFVRYLPQGAPVGSRQAFLSIGTYPMQNAFQVTKALAMKTGSIEVVAPKSAVAFYYRSRPENVFMAYPNSAYQIELFDPSAPGSKALVEAGTVESISAAASNGEQAVTPAQLRALSKQLGKAIYWLGPKPGLTYAFSRTADGRMYVRYLPKGVAPGIDQPYLTVGTYPMKDAYGVTRKLAKSSKDLRMSGNRVVLGLKNRPHNVYVAFRGTSYQIEIYDPTGSAAHTLAAASLVEQVR